MKSISSFIHLLTLALAPASMFASVANKKTSLGEKIIMTLIEVKKMGFGDE